MQDRIQHLLTVENLTPTKFADIIGIQRSAVSHILSGRNHPSYDVIQKILTKFPRINAEWLLMGKGEIYKVPVQQRLFDTDLNPSSKVGASPTQSSNIQAVQVSCPSSKDPLSAINSSLVERVMIFYKDGTLKEYTPKQEG